MTPSWLMSNNWKIFVIISFGDFSVMMWKTVMNSTKSKIPSLF